MTPIPSIDLTHVLGGANWWKIARDVGTAAMSYWTGEQVPEIQRPQNPERPAIHDTRPPPQPPKLPGGLRVRR
jgi:hypothetical protein